MTFSPTRYDDLPDSWFRRCGASGLDLPAISLGMWHNFGDPGTDSQHLGEQDLHENATAMMRTAFDRGVTHFDFANNYGPAPAPPRSAAVGFSRRTSSTTARSW